MRRIGRAQPGHADIDADLVCRIVQGEDREAFDALYSRHSAAAYGIARRVLRDPELAEDVVQEVFLGLWTSPQRFDPSRGALRTWLLTVVHNRCVDVVRRSASRQTLSSDQLDDLSGPGNDTEDTALQRAEADRVRRALTTLPVEQRRALLLAYWGGHTQTEIAQITGVPVGTVKSRVFTGFKRLRAELQPTGEHVGGGER